MGGVGGTLAGNALSIAATRATLEHVLTDGRSTRMIALADALRGGVRAVIERTALPWSVSQLGARAEYRFASPAPRTGTESAAAPTRSWRTTCTCTWPTGASCSRRSTTWR